MAPEWLAVRGRDADSPLAGEINKLRRPFELDSDRRGPADAVVERLPEDAAVVLIERGDRLALASAGMHVKHVADDERRIAVAVLGAGTLSELEQVALPDELGRGGVETLQQTGVAGGIDAVAIHCRRGLGPGQEALVERGEFGVVAGITVFAELVAGEGVEADD